MQRYVTLSCLAIIVIPIAFLQYEYSYFQSLLATLLLVACAYPTARRYARNESGIPALPILCVAYAIQFGLPIFTHDATIRLKFGDIKPLTESEVIAALIMAIIGVVALQAGYYAFGRSRFRKAIPAATLNLDRNRAVIYCVVAGLLLPLLLNSRGLIPEQFQLPLSSILRLLQNQVFVVIGVLGWIVYSRHESKLYSLWLYGLVFASVIGGMAEGSLESALVPIAVLFVVKWLYTRKVPVATVIAVVVIILFLSPVKAEYRDEIWFSERPETVEESSISKATLWFTKAVEYWQDTLSGNRDLDEATSTATARTDFIHQVAHIYSLTPSVIPYQYGETYSYFLVAFVPRALWPDKPVSGNANSFFAVTYDISSEEGVKTTTFGVSLLGEAFINFGWYGVVFVMFVQGLIIGLCQHMFGEARSGAGGQAVFLAFFVFFLNGLGSSAEILFGNILQNLFCGYFLLLWTREKPIRLILPKLPFVFQSKQ